MKIFRYKQAIVALCCLVSMVSCSDMLDTDSDMVEFAEDNTLSTPQDTLYSVMGIIRQMQVIADRTVLLGEVRADLMTTTDKATTAVKQMAAFDFNEENPYNRISDYYAVINNCNYYLANADTNFVRLGKKIFEKEYAAVKTYRAWTYLQLAKVYGQVPLVTEPVLTEMQAEQEMNKTRSDITAICNYFINDLQRYVDTEIPQYGEVGSFNSKFFFIPVRVLLGEMCLWAGRYQEAATYFSQYLNKKNAPVITRTSGVRWIVTNGDFINGAVSDGFTGGISSGTISEQIAAIPMETSEFYGMKSLLADVFESTNNNFAYFQITPSAAMRELSASQDYVLLSQTSDTQKDTIRAPKEGLWDALLNGDLRLYASYRKLTVNRNETSSYSSDVQYIQKLPEKFVSIYRVQEVYLLFAEALCRAGYPESAFCILKYGLRAKNIERYVSAKERERVGSLIDFDDETFPESVTQGIHSRGCGNAECDKLYCLPEPAEELASYEDTVQFRIPLVEEMIIEEKALEQAFEGKRYYDLMRIALRRGDNSFLAAPIAKRNGTRDEALFNLLMDNKNWYLPLK